MLPKELIMQKLVIDLETTLDHKTIWCCCCEDVDTGWRATCTTAEQFTEAAKGYDVFVGHNIIGFDAPVLAAVWGVTLPPESLCDTLILSRLYSPSIDGGHSLDAWGKRLGDHKIAFTDYDGGLTSEMIEYCIQDVALTKRLLGWLTKTMDDEGFSDYCVELEHKVALIVKQQEVNGFKLDIAAANTLYNDLVCRMKEIEAGLQEVFPPIVLERWSEKTGKQLKDSVTVFNPGSRQQIADRLGTLGAVFKDKTDKGSIIVNEGTLDGIDLPEAKLVLEYLTLQKRVGLLDGWMKALSQGDRVHGKVRTNGAVTGRMTHSSPNMAQVPSVKVGKDGKPLLGAAGAYGYECRGVWIVDEGNVLVGADASGLELRMLAHYMDDVAYTNEVVSGDVHTANMKAAGLTDRSQAKTFIYAFLYGAGAGKMGSIVNGTAKDGQKLMTSFLEATPSLAALRERVEKEAGKGTIKGLDGRVLRVRSAHSAVNTLLQGAGAIVMKQALVILDAKIKRNRLDALFVANVHDEWQIEAAQWAGKAVGSAAVASIREAGEYFEMKCPLDGAYKIGLSWAETH